MAPVSYTGRAPTLLEAAFTATSATTVTGLGVVDTATFWTGFGQVVILVLIIRRRLSLQQRLEAAASSRTPGIGDVARILRALVVASAAAEGMVAAILAARFWLAYGMDPLQAVWNGVFHAVSAFNNAGFALFSLNLMGFVGDPLICLPIAFAIICGGLGLPVILALRHG